MNSNKRFLVAQAVLMYLFLIPMFVGILGFLIPAIGAEAVVPFFVAGLFSSLAYGPVIFASFVIAVFGLLKNMNSPLATALWVKIVLIPWYIINFVFCFALVAGLLNPFTFVAVPVVIALEVGITWILMFSTGLHSLTFVIRKIACKEVKINGMIVVAIILHFIFMLDILGAIFLQKELSKNPEVC